MTSVPLLEITSVSKSFPGQRALKDVRLELRAGEIHALIGQNGCGKSTMMRILTGYYKPDEGSTALVRGVPTPFSDLVRTVPVRAVHQDLGLIPDLSIADNIAIGSSYCASRTASIAWRQQYRLTRDLLAQHGIDDLDPRTAVRSTTAVQRTMIAIARAVAGWTSPDGLLILDEPTSALPADEAGELVALMRRLADSGTTILFVSHSLQEVIDVCDRATVLREGSLVTTTELAGLSERDLLLHMVGRDKLDELDSLEQTAGASAPPSSAQVVDRPADPTARPAGLRVQGLRSFTVHDLSFEVGPGEVLGIAGLAGSGHLDVPYQLTGGRPPQEGRLWVGDQEFDLARLTSTRAAANGIAFVPADRATEGSIATLSTTANISLACLPRFRGPTRVISRRRERQMATEWVERLGIFPADVDVRVGTMSGGNRQKVVLAKSMSIASACLILADPTVGVDTGAKMQIYHFVRQSAEAGLPVVVCSTDPTDFMAMCDRVIALFQGRAVAELRGADLTEPALLNAISVPATASA